VEVTKYGPVVQVTQQMLDDAADYRRHVIDPINAELREMFTDVATGQPRYGPRRVLNDLQQADLDDRNRLASALLELADEWGVYDLVRGDE
jgi:hypothetical protein